MGKGYARAGMLISDTVEQAARSTEVASVAPALRNACNEVAVLHLQDQLTESGVIRRRCDIGQDVVESFLRYGFVLRCVDEAFRDQHSPHEPLMVRDRRLFLPRDGAGITVWSCGRTMLLANGPVGRQRSRRGESIAAGAGVLGTSRVVNAALVGRCAAAFS